MTPLATIILSAIIAGGSLAALSVAEPETRMAGSGDYVLIVPGEPAICAKSRDTCETARQAIALGWMPEISRLAKTACEPRPGCFDQPRRAR